MKFQAIRTQDPAASWRMRVAGQRIGENEWFLEARLRSASDGIVLVTSSTLTTDPGQRFDSQTMLLQIAVVGAS
jgi:hypothetical protein